MIFFKFKEKNESNSFTKSERCETIKCVMKMPKPKNVAINSL